MTSDILKPCPFCGCKGIHYDKHNMVYYCNDCEAQGPCDGEPYGWNTRADRAPAADAELLVDLDALRWLLNMSNEDNRPRMQLTTAMDKVTNSKGETHRVILERLYKNTRALLSRAEAGRGGCADKT